MTTKLGTLFCTLIHLSLMLFHLSGVASSGNGNTAAHDLKQHLFSKYSTISRPVSDSRKITNVTYKFFLNQLLHLSEQEQKMKVTVWQLREWWDEYLKWDPEDFNNITDIRVNSNEIWVPDLVVTNAVEVTEVPIKLKVNYTGKVSWDSSYVMVTSCLMNVKYFPYDKQACHVLIGSWTYSIKELILVEEQNSSAVDLNYYIENDEWVLIRATTSHKLNYYPGYDAPLMELCIRVVLGRRPEFYELNIIFPSTLIFVCVISVFLLPCGSGEKIALNITILLSLAVNNVRISETMPPSSKNSPLLAEYFILQISVVTMSIFFTSLVLSIFHRGKHHAPMPQKIRRVLRHLAKHSLLGCCDQVKNEDRRSALQIIYNSMESHKLTLDNTTLNSVMSNQNGSVIGDTMILTAPDSFWKDPKICTQWSKMARLLNEINNFLVKLEEEGNIDQEWMQLANLCDRVLYFIFIFIALSMAFMFKFNFMDKAHSLPDYLENLCELEY